jgi:TolB-like protein
MELPPSIQIVRGTVPDDLEGAIMHALEKVPADRFATVSQFKDALLGQGATTAYMRRTRGYTRELHSTRTVPAVRRRRRTLVLGAVGMVVLASATLAARYFWHPSTTSVTQAGNVAHDLSASRIAVLYFDNETQDSALTHVATGLTESLIAQLSQVEGLDIISAGGVAPFQHAAITTDSIARSLKVGTLVRGGIGEDAGKLRVTVQLVDASGAQFQRASFLVPRGEYLHARDSLAGVVSDLLRRRLGEEIRLREQRSGTTSAEAWALVQRIENERKQAVELITSSKPDEASRTLIRADSLASTAGTLDSRWAQPSIERGWISYARTRLTKDQIAIAALLDSAFAHASHALILDPRSPEALELRATIGASRAQRGLLTDQRAIDAAYDAAEADLQQAVSIAPRQATAWYALSQVEFAKKKVLEASNAARRAYESDAYLRAAPTIVYNLWAMSYNLEQFVDAINWCSLGGQRFPKDPRFVRCRLFLMLSKAVPSNPAQAWGLVDDLQGLTPKQDWDYNRREAELLVAVVLGRAGLVDSAHHVIDRARASTQIDPRGELIGLEALVDTFLGEHEKAITTLEHYLSNFPEHRAGFGKVNAWWWRDLQKYPRFQALAATGR